MIIIIIQIIIIILYSSNNIQNFTNKKCIYTFWTGDNEMPENRKRCLYLIKKLSNVDVILITKDNLNQYILEPLHPSYEYLSFTHRADYLRTYFMHFYGGGYSDIKETTGSWDKYFDILDSSDYYAIGYT